VSASRCNESCGGSGIPIPRILQNAGIPGPSGTRGGGLDIEVAFDSHGNIYVSDFNRVRRFKMTLESR